MEKTGDREATKAAVSAPHRGKLIFKKVFRDHRGRVICAPTRSEAKAAFLRYIPASERRDISEKRSKFPDILSFLGRTAKD